MTSTIADISGGRCGVNIVSGWHKIEYSQMGLWPGDAHFSRRYDYSTEYVQIMRDLWETGRSDLKGEFFQMEDCKLSPRPAAPISLVSAGQSDRGMAFAAQYCDVNFALGEGVNEPTLAAGVLARMLEHGRRTGRDVGSYMLYMVIADATDEAAMAKWDHYNVGADQEALAHLLGKAAEDPAPAATSMAAAVLRSPSPINFDMGTLVGSYGKVASMLDEAAAMPGVKGIIMHDKMKAFDDPRVRRALIRLVDKTAMTDIATFGHGAPTVTPLPPTHPYFRKDLSLGPDIAGAKKLLAEAGLGAGFPIEMYIPSADPPMERLATAFRDAAKQAGITVSLRIAPQEKFFAEMEGKVPLNSDNFLGRTTPA